MFFRFFFFILALTLLLDVYSYQAVRTLTRDSSDRTQLIVRVIFWSITALTVLALLITLIRPVLFGHRIWRFSMMAFFSVFYIPKIFAVVFLLLDDLIRLFRWLFGQMRPKPPGTVVNPISRSKFLSQSGLLLAGFVFFNLVYGIVRGAYDFQVKRYTLRFKNLPRSFDGFRLIQISDIHTGSFINKEPVRRAIRMINKEQADLILFTGDLVNSASEEANEYVPLFAELRAAMGVYSIKGNHDYGDYNQWHSAEEKQADQHLLDQHHRSMGWTLLKDRTVALERNGESIALIGMENWGRSFQQYGSLEKACEGADKYPFRILMSHDPTCFEEQVLKERPDIDLTLSGHTHGMQFGVKAGNFEWSPVSAIYKYWAGLYKVGEQYLNVNRGFGFIGYPGRVGILPEITVIELKCV